jgi:hypothetical protein
MSSERRSRQLALSLPLWAKVLVISAAAHFLLTIVAPTLIGFPAWGYDLLEVLSWPVEHIFRIGAPLSYWACAAVTSILWGAGLTPVFIVLAIPRNRDRLLRTVQGRIAPIWGATRSLGAPAPSAGGRPSLKEKQVKVICTLVGAIIGLMVVRGFLLDTIEEMGWRMFWHGFFNGKLRSRDIQMVFQSATFMKSILGIIAGGVAGLIVATKYGSSPKSVRRVSA